MKPTLLRALLLASLHAPLAITARAETVQIENSASPDGAYALTAEDAKGVNKLVALPKGKTIATIDGIEYFPGWNHADLLVDWAPDSSNVVLAYSSKWTTDTLDLCLVGNGKMTKRVPLIARIEELLLKHVHKTAPHLTEQVPSLLVTAEPTGRGKGGTINFKANGFTNPKGFDNEITIDVNAVLAYAIATDKLTLVKAEGLDPSGGAEPAGEPAEEAAAKETPAEGTAEAPDGVDEPFDVDASIEEADALLNAVYAELKKGLSEAAAEILKKEQRAWLLKRDSIDDPRERLVFIRKRIRKLKDESGG